ncbi:MAG: transposase, partial [Planctomycetes bacterium]|nr:transposase [Planctomycetota bacterium]
LHETGSVFVQISDENVHHVREICDEVFGVNNFVAQVYFQTTSGRQASQIDRVGNYVVWYAKNTEKVKFRCLFLEKPPAAEGEFSLGDLQSQGVRTTGSYEVKFDGKTYVPQPGNHWKITEPGMKRLIGAGRVVAMKSVLRFRRLPTDFPAMRLADVWTDVSGGAGAEKVYVVQTGTSVAQRCLLMTSDPGDLVLDITCGSGTTAVVAEQWGRRWITCDTSRVALTLAKMRLLTAVFDYYQLAHPDEGVGSGLVYKSVPHVTLKSIANHEPPEPETLYDQPLVDTGKTRVTGPFTVEAVPAPLVVSPGEVVAQASPPASSAFSSSTSTPKRESATKETAGGTPALRSGWHARGYLPHLKAEGGTYFVTFRLTDTLPKAVLESYRSEREAIVKRAEAAGRKLTRQEDERLAALYSERIESYLDAGHGECWLKEPRIGGMVAETLRHFDGERYDLHAWVVMPNHVHAVVTPREGHTLSAILHSWKSFTAHETHRVAQASRLQLQLPKGGAFWQRESYDHLVRDEADFQRVCEYTVQNPVKAGLCQNPEDWPCSSAETRPGGETMEDENAGEDPAPNRKQGYETMEHENAGEDAGATIAADASVARSGITSRLTEWRDELLRTGLRGRGGAVYRFSRLEPLPGLVHLHADGEIGPDAGGKKPRNGEAAISGRAVVSFGPEFAPLERQQVELALDEVEKLRPRPAVVVFAAFHFDEEAAKNIDETRWPGVALLKAQMNADLFTDDLKKRRAGNESFWLVGQPDVRVERIGQGQGENEGKYRVSVHGFDYFSPTEGNLKRVEITSRGADHVAVWMLDPDYDGRSLYPRQVFFPMADGKSGWSKLARNLKAEIDEGLIEAYRGTVSLPFEAGEHRRAAVKIVDDRGIESLRVLALG